MLCLRIEVGGTFIDFALYAIRAQRCSEAA
jgi:hypothetical protein